MVAETHPHDIELFEYVEDELPAARRDEIAAHLATCDVCAEQVRQAAVGREALRETTLLELPDGRRDEILKSLSAKDREPTERRPFSPRLVLGGLIGLLALAAVIGALVSSNQGAGDESSAGDVAAETSGGGGGTAEAVAPQADLSANGSAADVAEELQAKGFRAVVQKDRVVVHGATKQQVREALADRGPGDVEVVVKNP
jgi:anti-sigma factor RsiW